MMTYEERLEVLLKVGHEKLSAQVILALQDKLAEVSELYERHQKWRSMDLRNIRKHEETIRILREAAQSELTRLQARVKELEWQYSQTSGIERLNPIRMERCCIWDKAWIGACDRAGNG